MKFFRKPSRAAITLAVCMVALIGTTIVAQQGATARSDDATTTKLICELISRYHISQSKLDDDISSKLVDRFLKDLDPQKLYFTKPDVAAIQKQRTQLDDSLKLGNVDFAYQTFDTYKARLQERIKLAHVLIDLEHNFNLDESIVVDPDDLAFPADEKEAYDRWRKRIKSDLLGMLLEDTKIEDARDRLHKRYRMIGQTITQTEKHEVLEMYLSAVAHCFDPHSSYMSPQTLEDFNIQMRLSLDGIGAALRSEDGYTTVAQIVPGGAADADGRLKIGDKVTAVAQEAGDFVDIVEMKLSKVVRLIRGPRGSKVRLRVTTAKDGLEVVYELTRKKIELKSDEVKGEILESKDRLKGTNSRVGVINIPSFYRDFSGAQQGVENFKSTARDVKKVLLDFKQKGGVDGIIIDLRTNGGGALSEAIEVSGLFIDQGPVVQVKELNGRVKAHNDDEAGVYYSGPLVVVCNRLSASASEIFAGVIKDYGRGIVVGDETTHGKGTVQNVMPVSQRLFQFLNPKDRGALKLTINQFYRVNGDSTQNRGVRSDIVLPSILDHMELGESFLDNALAFDKIEPAQFQKLGMNPPNLISQLQNTSKQRIAADPKFQETLKDIDRFEARKKQKSVSLNLETRRKERKKEKPEEDPKEEDANNKPIFPDEAYNNELLNITVDYVNALKNLATAKN